MKNNCKECYEENKTPNIDDCNCCKMPKKYVITNCPALFTSKDKTFSNDCCNEPCKSHCKDITDCLLKRIVENLKTCLEDNTCDNCDGVGYYDGCQDIKCGDYQARKSLELLEIEEVNE